LVGELSEESLMSCPYTPYTAVLCFFFAFGIVRGEGPPAVIRPQGRAGQQLKVAVAQPLVLPGKVKQNIQNMESLVAAAAKRGAELVVFSECGITGYDLKGVGVRAAISSDDSVLDMVAVMARRYGTAIIAGFHEKRGDKLYNTAAVFLPDGRRVIQRKYNVLKPEKDIAPTVKGERKRTIFKLKGFRLAVLICSDDGTPGIYDELAAERCDAVVLICAGAGSDAIGFHASDLADAARRKKYTEMTASCLSPAAIERCIQLKWSMIACNQCGWDKATGYFHPGGSSIVDRTGEVTAVIPMQLVFENLRPDLAVGSITR
jgi:predicted amidohydrolase